MTTWSSRSTRCAAELCTADNLRSPASPLALCRPPASPFLPDNATLLAPQEYGARSFLNGKANPGEKVTVRFNEKGPPFPAVADANGEWEVQFNRAGVGTGPGNVTVVGEEGPAITAKNVMGGDVYFCSGQSNMVFPTKFAYNPAEEMATLADYPNFRFFATGRDFSPTPQWDLAEKPIACDAEPCNQWLTTEQATAVQPGKLPKSPLPNTFLANFSAVCFMTARDIARMHTGDRPVALIYAAWGGTRVEAWMSTRAIEEAAVLAGAMPPPKSEQNNVSVLYNAMVAPWNKFSVRAALWCEYRFAATSCSLDNHKCRG